MAGVSAVNRPTETVNDHEERPMTRILLVDDDIELSGMLAEYFEQEGFHAHTVGDGESGVSAALSNDFDVVVLDVMMPRMNGIEVLRAIRARSTVPVLMLTARGDDIDRILGLELGADDYVPKPCSPRELVARVRAILRRLHPDKAEANQDAQIQAGELIMWPQSRTAQWGHTPAGVDGNRVPFARNTCQTRRQRGQQTRTIHRCIGPPAGAL